MGKSSSGANLYDLGIRYGSYEQVTVSHIVSLLYEGKKENNQPLWSQVVNSLLYTVEDYRQHTVYFNNFFTSYYSLKKHVSATRTVRDNRTAKCPLHPEKDEKACQRFI